MSDFNKQARAFLDRTISQKYTFLLYSLLALLFILPLLMAGLDYVDDTSRKLEGSYQWGGLGRVLTEALMHIVTFSAGDMVDVGSLVQLLAIPTLATAGYLVTRLVAGDGHIKVRDWLVGAVVVVNPLLLPNLSFRFDSLSMVIGYTLSIYAGYLFLRTTGVKRYAFSILLLLAAIMMYQVTVMMFAVIVVVGFSLQYANLTKKMSSYIYPILIKAALTLSFVFVIYYVIVKLVDFKFLVGQRSGLVSLSVDGLRQIKLHYIDLIKVLSDFIGNTEGLIVGVFITIIGFVSLFAIIRKQLERVRVFDSIIFLSLPLILFLVILGPFVLMQSSISMQVRVMMAAVGLPLVFLAMSNSLQKSKPYFATIGVVAGIMFITYTLNMSFVYGSALKQQRDFDRTVYQALTNVIMNDTKLYTSKALYIGGETTYPMVVQNVINKRPILNRLDISGDNTRWYIFNSLKDHGVANVVDQYLPNGVTQDLRTNICHSSLLKTPYVQTEYFSIYSNVHSDEFLVWLTNPFTNQNLICDL